MAVTADGLLTGLVNGTQYFRQNATEPYVEIPPALLITDTTGACWTLGSQFVQHKDVFEFNVLCNDRDTGEMASRIVYQRGQVHIFGHYGRKTLSRNRRHFV